MEVNESAGHHEDVEELMGVELEQGGVWGERDTLLNAGRRS